MERVIYSKCYFSKKCDSTTEHICLGCGRSFCSYHFNYFISRCLTCLRKLISIPQKKLTPAQEEAYLFITDEWKRGVNEVDCTETKWGIKTFRNLHQRGMVHCSYKLVWGMKEIGERAIPVGKRKIVVCRPVLPFVYEGKR